MKTLVLFTTGGTKRDVFLQTYFGFLLKGIQSSDFFTRKIRNQKYQQLFHMLFAPYESLSYVNDWKEAFDENQDLSTKFLNILNQKEAHRFLKKHINQYELIVLLHSVIGDNMELITPYGSYLKNRKGKLLSFVGNEYILMKEKKNFLMEVEVDYIASQLPKQAFSFVYKELNAVLIEAPHALQEKFYKPGIYKRKFDISFVGAQYPIFIGDRERNNFIKYVSNQTPFMNNNINIGKNANVPRHLWKEILQKSNATVGAEAGTYFLDRNGSLLEKAKIYCENYPNADLEEILEEIFNKTNKDYISGKALSSRHFEPIGTHTCQILLEGDYHGILIKDEHYISVKKDYSNFDQALDTYLDPKKRNDIVEKAYNFVIKDHTYSKRIQHIINKIN